MEYDLRTQADLVFVICALLNFIRCHTVTSGKEVKCGGEHRKLSTERSSRASSSLGDKSNESLSLVSKMSKVTR